MSIDSVKVADITMRQEDRLSGMGAELVDQMSISRNYKKDGEQQTCTYTLALTRNPTPVGQVYVVGLQLDAVEGVSPGGDFMDIDDHSKNLQNDIGMSKISKEFLNGIIERLITWAKKYGEVVIASNAVRKITQYERFFDIFKREFLGAGIDFRKDDKYGSPGFIMRAKIELAHYPIKIKSGNIIGKL